MFGYMTSQTRRHSVFLCVRGRTLSGTSKMGSVVGWCSPVGFHSLSFQACFHACGGALSGV